MLGKRDSKTSDEKQYEAKSSSDNAAGSGADPTAIGTNEPSPSAIKPRKKSLIGMFVKTSKKNSLTPANDATNDDHSSDTDSIGPSKTTSASRDLSRRASNISIISDVGNKVGRRMSQAISEVDWKEVNTCMQQTF